MQGAIIATACAIAIESRDQSIDRDVVPLADIMRDGQGRRKSFLSIWLIVSLNVSGVKIALDSVPSDL